MLRRVRYCHSIASVCLSATFRYRYCAHIGWNSSKITSRPNSLRVKTYALADPNMGDLVQRDHPKITVE